MHKPNYADGSIVNLMSTIARSYGATTRHRPLRILPKIDAKQLVFIVVDGLGYEFLKSQKSFLWKHNLGKLTSVFPSTTATAITSFFTGETPSMHGITGWFTYSKEVGSITVPLRGRVRNGGFFDLSYMLKYDPLFARMRVRSCGVTLSGLEKSAYNNRFSRKLKMRTYKTISGFRRQIEAALHDKYRFIYAYWAGFDEVCHHKGTAGREAVHHYYQLERVFKRLARSGATIVITADHGLIDVDKQHAILLDDHPILKDMLIMPLSGEARAAYCYVRDRMGRKFCDYVRKNLSHACTIRRGKDVLPLLGPKPYHPYLSTRIGDYVLLMKKDYILMDSLPFEKRKIYKGYHGGLSKDEMYVPLIVINGSSFH